MPKTVQQIRKNPNFDSVARLYRWAEYLLLGPLLQRTRERLLPQVLAARQALVLGDGDGRFLAALLRRSPNLHALAVDTSPAMLALLRRRCRFAAPRLRTLNASALDLPHALGLAQTLAATDLVVAHFFFDCLTPPEVHDLVSGLGPRLAPDALWLLADFALPSRQPWRTLGATYVRLLYLAFRILTGLRVQALPDPQRALASAGFTHLQRETLLHGLLYTELWQRSPSKIGPPESPAIPEAPAT